MLRAATTRRRTGREWGTGVNILSDSLRRRSEDALRTFREEYARQHRTKLNRRLHLWGRVMRAGALVAVFHSWNAAAALFVAGYLVQFLGHAIEGTSPSFFRNPKHLLLGSLNHVASLFEGNDSGRHPPRAQGEAARRGRSKV
jgi:hypothetical protein